MRQSILFTKTRKEIGTDEVSLNASLLIRGGFIDKLSAGIYTYLPLGLKVIDKIKNIIREEMNAMGGQEILMPALTPKEIWETTNRWNNFDALFRLSNIEGKEYALGATHEEIVTPLLKKYIFSYKDLPKFVYQIQTKFRNEPRAKSGLLRGREFLMKDLYSFHADQNDLDKYYEKAIRAYFKVFKRLELDKLTYLTFASGGAFSKYSHEFQTLAANGEDTIYICEKCKIAYNKEIINEISECQNCKLDKDKFKEAKSIETGNIFKLGSRFSKSFDFKFKDKDGQEQDVIMGCYGMGPSRIMGTLAEIFNDGKGLIWPITVTPFTVHFILISKDNALAKKADKLYDDLTKMGLEVLYDDRDETAGVKLNDSDLIGIPFRLILSEKTLKADSVEIKRRDSDKVELIKIVKIADYFKSRI